MAFRVEITVEAERDAHGILDWLISQQADETGLRWFLGLEKAIASIATFPQTLCSSAGTAVAATSKH
jgi:hypothetical protein